MSDFLEKISTIFLAIGIIAIIILPFAWIVMLLWNGLAVPIFNAPILSFWETYGLLIMVNLISPFSSSSISKKG